MALNLKNADVERLAAEAARLTGESKTEAIRRALEERQARLRGRPALDRRARRQAASGQRLAVDSQAAARAQADPRRGRRHPRLWSGPVVPFERCLRPRPVDGDHAHAPRMKSLPTIARPSRYQS